MAEEERVLGVDDEGRGSVLDRADASANGVLDGAPIEVTVLGEVCVGAGAPLRGRLAMLTAALVLAEPHVVSTDELLRRVFADRAHDARPHELFPLVSRLRRRLREAGAAGDVRAMPGGYGLVDVATDVGHLTRLVAAATATEAADPGRAGRLAAEAWALGSRGVALAELVDHPAAVRLDQLTLHAAEIAGRTALATGQHASSVAPLLEACERWPFAEELCRIAVVALYRSGRQVDALAHYERLRRRLADELGLEPGPELRRTALAVLRQADDDDPGSATVSLGSITPSAAPPGYDDRYVEVPGTRAALLRAVAGTRLVTVTGPAGIGKTRLVTECAAEAATSASALLIFCDLSAVAAPDELAGTVAAVAGVRVPPGAEPIAALAEAWRQGRRLVVLDTCEHVLDGVARLVQHLLARCPDLTVVATSRAPLRVSGELVWPVPALDDPALATELFVERARRAAPAFRLDRAEEATVAELCSRLDALPLAIELAAARSGALAPGELLARLDDRLGLLTSGAETRHASLRAALDWSLRLLDEPHQRAFRTLGAFSGPFDLELAEQLLAQADVDDGAAVMAALAERSLVVTRRSGAGTRYRLLDALRARARELLAEHGETATAFSRHASVVAARKDGLVRAGEGPDDVAATASLSELWPELRGANAWAAAAGDAVAACRLVVGLGSTALFQERREVFAWAESALGVATSTEVPAALAAGVAAAGVVAAWACGRHTEATVWAARADDAVRQQVAPLTSDLCMSGPFRTAFEHPADIGAFVTTCQAAATGARAAGNRYGELWALNGAAMGEAYLGRFDAALETTDRIGRLLAANGNTTQEAFRQFARSIALLDDDPAAALEAADAALAAAGRVGATWFVGVTPNYQAAALVRVGELDRAVSLVTATLDRLAGGAPVQSVANTVRNTVVLLERLGRAESAVPLIGWFDAHPVPIPGTPGMRAHVEKFRAGLGALVAPDRLAALLAEGAGLELDEVVALARQALA